METSEFYDSRGKDALEIKFRGIGSKGIDEKFRAPYLYYEESLPLPEVGATFLDLGCGTGVHSIHPARLGYNVTGVDISEKSIEAAEYIATQHNVERHCQFVLNNAIEFLKGAPAFDVIFTSGSLYYFDIREIIPLIKSKLKPKGNFFCIETNGSNYILNQMRKIRHGKSRDERTMKHLLGLSDIEYMKTQFSKSDVKFFSIYRLPAPPTLSFKFVFHGQRE